MWPFIFMLSGVALLIYGVGLVRDARTCANWPKAEGRVTRAEIQVVGRESNKATYTPDVTYVYQVEGKSHESSRLTLVPRNSRSEQSVREILVSYPVGARVTVFYEPKDPSNSVLVTTSTGNEWAYPIAGVLMIGVGILYLRK